MRNRNNKRVLAILLAMTMIFSMVPTVFAATVADIPVNTLRIGNDFYSLDSDNLSNNDKVAASLVANHLANFKFTDGKWYDVFSLTDAEIGVASKAISDSVVNNWTNLGTWYKSGSATDTMTNGQSPVNVTAVTAIPDINVANGTALTAVGLPTTVEITKSDNTKANVAVNWDGGTPAYNATTAGTYKFSGTLTLPSSVNNPSNVKASVNVIVAAPELQVITISSVFAQNGLLSVLLSGAPATAPVLSDFSVMQTVYSNGSNSTTPITPSNLTLVGNTVVNLNIPTVAASVYGDQTVTDTVYYNASSATSNSFSVNGATISIATINGLAGVTTTVGAEPTLPSVVGVTYSDGTTGNVRVIWNTANLNINTAGTYTITGAVAGTTSTASIVVTVNAATPTLTAANVTTKDGAAVGLLAVKVDFPAGVTNVKITKVDSLTLSPAADLTSGYFKNVPGTYSAGANVITFSFDVNGATQSVTITK